MKPDEIKAALAKMLPDVVERRWIGSTAIGTNQNDGYWVLWWKGRATAILDTELLHLCSLAEATITRKQMAKYRQIAWYGGAYETVHERLLRATWQQRVTALAKVKGIEP